MIRKAAHLALLIVMGFTVSCKKDLRKRPDSVPAKATPIAIPYGFDWDYCWVDKAMNVNKCQIYNGNGLLMYDDVFVRYEGTEVVPEESLKITQKGGEQWIELEDGTILIPESDYSRIRKTLDWLKGRSSHP